MKTDYQIKRNKYLALLLIVPIITAAVAELYAILSSYANDTYAITTIVPIMRMTEAAMVLLAAIYIAGFYVKGRIAMYIIDAVRIAVAVMLCVCFYQVLAERATLMGYVWFSDLESGNANSVRALNCGVIAAVMYAVTVLLIAASGWLEFVTAKKIKRTPDVVRNEIEQLRSELAGMEQASETAEAKAE